ncbi:MAG: T9SS type A sorting domain-containing protein [Chitinophagales bacterium]|nr:T9SS type A sorting domain-containing protein [Chitinophagales bacterium]MDW8428681.1 T9SS type A sorting domain-containing protein [Chitinophagales bacterium]
MTNLYFLLKSGKWAGVAACLLSMQAQAQSTALDFQAYDCGGTYHHLFQELDQGYVVVLEFAMMNCAPCVTAGKGIETLVAPFQNTHPGRVHFYTFGYENSIDCDDMNNWLAANGMNHPVFAGDAVQTNYYGGMGMPTIVVVGNPSHKVYYNQKGYSPSHDKNIKSAIEQALAEYTGIGSEPLFGFWAYPNPFNTQLNVSVSAGSGITRVVLSDLTGKAILTREGVGGVSWSWDLSQLPEGTYFLSFFEGKKLVATRKFSKRYK